MKNRTERRIAFFLFILCLSAVFFTAFPSFASAEEPDEPFTVRLSAEPYTVLGSFTDAAGLNRILGEHTDIEINVYLSPDEPFVPEEQIIVPAYSRIEFLNGVIDCEGKCRALSCVSPTSLSFRNVTIRNGYADRGGGILVLPGSEEGTDSLIDGTASMNIENCKAVRGGGICFEASHACASNLSVENCEAEKGGGVFISGDKCRMETVRAESCKATEGGGFYIGGKGGNFSTFAIQSCQAGTGGGVFAEAAESRFYRFDVGGCTAETNGGGFFIGASTVSLGHYDSWSRSTVHECRAEGSGGGVFVSGETCTIDNTYVKNSSCGGDGAGIFIGGDKCVIKNSVVSGNTAVGKNSDGGGIFVETDCLAALISYCTLQNNSEDNGKDRRGWEIDGRADTIVKNCKIENEYGIGSVERAVIRDTEFYNGKERWTVASRNNDDFAIDGFGFRMVVGVSTLLLAAASMLIVFRIVRQSRKSRKAAKKDPFRALGK